MNLVEQGLRSGVIRVATTGSVLLIGLLVWAAIQRVALARGRAPDVAGEFAGMARAVEDLKRDARDSARIRVLLTAVTRHDPLLDLLTAGTQIALVGADADGAMLTLRESVGRGVNCGCGPDVPCCVVAGDADLMGSADHGAAVGSRRRDSQMPESPLLSVPLRHSGGSLGELVVMRRGVRPFVPADTRLLTSVADACAAAVADARARIEEQDRAVLEERQRIARELHDSLAQVLAVTHLRLRALGSRSELVDLGPLRDEVDQIADVCHEGYRDVREAILGLHDVGDGQRTFLELLRVYMDKYSDQCGIRAVLDAEFADGLVLAPHTELHMVRVIQEALTNVRKHSGARTVEVRVAQEPTTTLVVIEDDGRGFDVGGVDLCSGGYGLSSMRERLALLGGSLTVKSAPGSGSCVIAQLPRGSQHLAAVPKGSDERDRPFDPHPAG